MFQLHGAGSHLLCHPGLVFVILALSRDPLHAAGLCKRKRIALDPGSSPWMTKVSWMFQLYWAGTTTSQRLRRRQSDSRKDNPGMEWADEFAIA
jgi:hypothetical protein